MIKKWKCQQRDRNYKKWNRNSEAENITTKLKNLLERFNNRLEQTEERIRKLEVGSFETIKSEEEKQKKTEGK